MTAIPALATFATRATALRWASGVIDRLDARLLLQFVCACRHSDLIAHAHAALSPTEAAQFAALVQRRAAGEPCAYLLESAEFFGLSLKVSPATLIPRPETEELVSLVLEKVAALLAASSAAALNTPKPSLRILDLGTGSGAIPIALAKQAERIGLNLQLTAVDFSPAALAIAADNAAQHGVTMRWLESDWYQAVAGERFDVIVSNPPYIAADDPHLALNGLPFEPATALTDGGDGMACLRQIIANAAMHLQPHGWLLLEHGHEQGTLCRNLLSVAGFKGVFSRHDLSHNERFSGGQWQAV